MSPARARTWTARSRVERTNREATLVMDSLVSLTYFDLEWFWITDQLWSRSPQGNAPLDSILRSNFLLSCILFIIFRVVLACLDVTISAAYNCSSSVSVVGDPCLVRGDFLQWQACVVDICTDDPQCKWRILLFLCRGVCKKMTCCSLRILNNNHPFICHIRRKLPRQNKLTWSGKRTLRTLRIID